MSNDALNRLASLAGIEDGWWDFFGQYRLVPADTKRAFLSAMGFAVADDTQIAASLAEFEARPWRRWLEPVQVVSERDGPPTITIAVPDHHEDMPIDWVLTEEIGAQHKGEFRPRALPMVDERGIDGVWHRRHTFQLPGAPLPGIHNLRLRGPAGIAAEMTLIVSPARAYQPPAIEQDGRLWGVATQLYSLRTDGNWGVGDFSDLAELATRAGPLGASAIGVNPLHELFPCRPERFSPYSPSSRLGVNVIYIDVEAVPDFKESTDARRFFASPGFQARLAAAQNAKLVDYANVGSLKFTVLESCWKSFRANHQDDADSERGQSFRAFQAAGGRTALRLATFEALQDHFLRKGPDKGYWRHWPVELQDPDSAAVADFVETQRERVDFFSYLQWLADGQLAAAQAACCDARMPIGIYRDLGVGIADDGAEAWANQRLLCLGVSVGAPPDPLNLAGQDWGLVPFNPVTLREAAYRPLLEVLEANMTHAGAMRLDHAMSLQRLYWVPRGARADQGAYVRYPVADLFALVALASRRKGCLVIGEDLGTVPDGFREHMQDKAILGYRLLAFEKKDGGVFKTPGEILGQALVGFGTHDLPSLAGWWDGIDIESREILNVYPDPAMGAQERQGRAEDRINLVRALAAEGLIAADFPTEPGLSTAQVAVLVTAVYAYLCRTPSKLLMVQFEDVLGMVVQMNLPGTTDQHPNWRLRYPQKLDAMLADPRVVAVAGQLMERAFGSS